MSPNSSIRELVTAGCAIAGLAAAHTVCAAVIDPTSIYFRGGNCQPPTGTGGAAIRQNASATVNGDTVDVTKTYVRSEEPSGGHEPGGPIGGGGMEPGGGHEGGSGEEEESNELFSRLPPINMFMTLDNTGATQSYTFNETITNDTGVAWDGFLHDLRPPEGLAQFSGTSVPVSDVFPDADFSTSEESTALVNLLWMGGSLASGGTANFSFQVNFADTAESTDSSGQYRINLQEFPLVSTVPEPGTFGLLGAGLACLALARRRRKPCSPDGACGS